MILTGELLEKGRSRNGAFSSKQVKLLGLDFKDLWKGWQKDVIGENYHEDTIMEFIRLKDLHLKKGNKFSYSTENIKTINEAKHNLVLGLKKIDLQD